MELFDFDVGVYCCSLLVVEHCEQLYVWLLNDLFPQGLPYAAVLYSVEYLFLKSMAATKSGLCHSAALCRSGRNVNKWSVVEGPGLTPVQKMEMEQVGRYLDGDDGPLL